MKVKKEIDELRDIDEFLADLFKGLPMAPGSLYRIASQYLVNWNVEVDGGNREFIKNAAEKTYKEDWRESGGEINDAISKAIMIAGLGTGDKNLNRSLAEMAVGALMTLHELDGRRKLRVLDSGAGKGPTTDAILNEITRYEERKVLRDFCEFYLLEPSLPRVNEASERLSRHPLDVRCHFLATSHEDIVPIFRSGKFDLIVSSGVYHHMPFPDYLDDLYEILADDGVLIIADWFTTIWEQPSRIIPVLDSFGLDHDRIEIFRGFFDIPYETAAIDKKLSPEQYEANKAMARYLTALGDELSGGKESSLYFFEAHESLPERIEKMKKAGFELDTSTLSEKYKAFVRIPNNIKKLYPDSDIACVMAAGKGKKSEKK